MQYTLAEDSGQASGSASVDAATAGFPWEAEALSAAVEQDTWLVSFIDILTLLLTLFVLLLIHQDEARVSGSGAQPQAQPAPLEQARPAATPVELTALGDETPSPQSVPLTAAAPDIKADQYPEPQAQPTGEDPAADRDRPLEAARPAPAPASESAPQLQPADLATDAKPVNPAPLPDPFATPHEFVLPGIAEADPLAPGVTHLLVPAFEPGPVMSALPASDQHTQAAEPLPPADAASAGETQETQVEDPPAQVQARPDSGEAPPAHTSPADTLLDAFNSSALGERVEVSVHPGGVNLEISDNILFAPASAALTVTGLALLQELAEALRAQPWPIAVEGHTDNIPIETARFPSNWELSSARAAIVTRFLIKQGISPARIRAVGYADTRARAANLTPQGRARNRRVSFVLQIPAAP